jgi:steroid delta-isomerase-like uncharacterized protein
MDQPEGGRMSEDDLSAIACRLEEEVWNRGHLEALDELTTPNYTVHDLAAGEVIRGRDAVRESIVPYRSAFPDMNLVVSDVIREGDRVVVRWDFDATHVGELLGVPPTMQPVTVSGIDIFRIANGRIAEAWVLSADLRWLLQAGALPSGGS